MNVRIQPKVEILDDPLADAEAVADRLDGSTRATGWAQRARGGQRTLRTSTEGVSRYGGRECCYHHLVALEHRLGVDLQLPLETECPRCSRRFRVTIGPVDTTTGRGIPWQNLIR